MFTNDESKALFTRVMDRMVEARWLHRHIFTDGKGRALCLKKISETYRLTSDDRAAYAFDILAHGERLPDYVRRIELDDTLAEYWRESVKQLGLHGDEDGLLALVHILKGWTPDSQTPIKIDLI
jgi:hypothetical protein